MHERVSALPVLLISFAALALAACGSTSASTSPTSVGVPSTAIPTAAPTAATSGNLTCPGASTVNSALGLSVAAPASTPGRGLPNGDTGITCTYFDLAAKQVVIIDLGTGPVSVPFISLVEAGEKKAATAQGDTLTETNVSGVGSQAVIIAISKAGNPIEDGILAISGSSGLVVTVVPSASQSQLQSFASQLLG